MSCPQIAGLTVHLPRDDEEPIRDGDPKQLNHMSHPIQDSSLFSAYWVNSESIFSNSLAAAFPPDPANRVKIDNLQ